MSNDEEVEPSAIEKTVLRLEENRRIKSVLLFCFLLFFVSINAIIHEEYQAGLAFFLVAVLLKYAGDRKEDAAAFLGTSSLALLVVLHISLFGVHPVAVLLALGTYMAFKTKLDRSILGPISVYLVLDTVVEGLGPYWSLSGKLSSIGETVLTSPYYFGAISVIPVLYAFLRMERYFRHKFSNEVLASHGAYLTLGTASCLLFPIAYLHRNSALGIVVVPATICFLIYAMGLINLVNRRPQKGVFIANIPMLILLLEMLAMQLPMNG
jgi:hypothetical protein